MQYHKPVSNSHPLLQLGWCLDEFSHVLIDDVVTHIQDNTTNGIMQHVEHPLEALVVLPSSQVVQCQSYLQCRVDGFPDSSLFAHSWTDSL